MVRARFLWSIGEQIFAIVCVYSCIVVLLNTIAMQQMVWKCKPISKHCWYSGVEESVLELFFEHALEFGCCIKTLWVLI